MSVGSPLPRFIECLEADCSAPAEIVDDEAWESNHGEVIMAQIVGVCGHGFFLPAHQIARRLAGSRRRPPPYDHPAMWAGPSQSECSSS